MIDHGINFALSAWHMTDWIVEDDAYRDNLRAKLQIETTDKKKVCSRFQKFVAQDCPELESCRVIATSAKHLECARPSPRDPTFGAQKSPGPITWVNNRNEPLTWINEKGEVVTFISNLCIIQGGSRRLAAEIFTGALKWWRSFIDAL
jgi:hypothetical protein